MLDLLRSISLRHLRQAPFRTALVVFGVALGVATLVSMAQVNRSILGAFRESIERVAGRAQLAVTNGEAGVPAELVESVATLPEVAHAAGALELTVLRAGGKRRGPILLLGVDFIGDLHFVPITVEPGGADAVEDPLSIANDPSAILISRAIAQEDRIPLGGSIALMTPHGTRSFTVRGILEDTGIAETFGGAVAVMFLDAAQLAFDRVDRVDRIDIALRPDVDLGAARTTILERIGHRARVEPPDGRMRQISKLFDPIARSLDLSGTLAILIGMFLIYNAVSISVGERRREIGILRALGLERRGVSGLFCLEAAVIGLLGGVIGIGLGRVLAGFALSQASPTVSRFYAPIRPAEPRLGLDLILLGVFAGTVGAVLAALGPARAAAAIDPADTIRDRAPRASALPLPHRTMAIAGLALLPVAAVAAKLPFDLAGYLSIGIVLNAGVLLVPPAILLLTRISGAVMERSIGIMGRLASDNLARSIRRSALTVSALMLGVALSVGMAAWGGSLESAMMRWLDAALPADVYVTAGSPVADNHNTPFAADTLAKLTDIPGVRTAYGLSSVTLDVRDRRVQLLSLDAGAYFRELDRKQVAPIVTEGEASIDPARLIDRPGALLGEAAARGLHVHAGDRLAIDTAAGPKELEVVAVIVDYSSVLGTILIDRRWYEAWFGDTRIDTIDLFLAPEAAARDVAAEVRRRLGGGESLYVVSAGELRAEFRAALGEALAIFHSVDLVALAVALLGVIGTMFAAILDRSRELAMLRAVGATRRQVLASIVAEASLHGFAASLMGVAVGVPLGVVLVKVIGVVNTGWAIEYDLPLMGALRITLAVTAAAAVAGWISGRRAAGAELPRAE